METRPKANGPKDRVNLREQKKAINGDRQKAQLPSLWVLWASDIRFLQLPSGQSEEILVIMYRTPNSASIPSTSKAGRISNNPEDTDPSPQPVSAGRVAPTPQPP